MYYVTGEFRGTVDFDPGGGTDVHVVEDTIEAFLSKFDSSGNFLSRSWGNRIFWGQGVDVDSGGNAYVMGTFMSGSVMRLRSRSGTDNHSSNGGYDVFIVKYDADGNYLWGRTWGGSGYESSGNPRVDASGNVCAPGGYQSGVDFDPGTGSSYHTSNGGTDAFISKFDTSGNFAWARVWGSSGWDTAYGSEMDSGGNVLAAGRFEGSVVFDPGVGTDYHSAGDDMYVFLLKLTPDGAHAWARTWDGYTHWNVGSGLAVDASDNIYFASAFEGSVDFNPSGGDIHTSSGSQDAFVSKFSSTGVYQYALAWGGTGQDICNQAALDTSGNIYATGDFRAPSTSTRGPAL